MSVFVGIAGGTGSGKTTIARLLVERLGEDAVLFEMDCYYKDVSHLSKEEVLQYNFDHPDAMDFALMKQNLEDLKKGKTITKPVYEFAEHRRSFQYEEFPVKPFVVVEGIFALHEDLKDFYDYAVFVDVEEYIRISRRVRRDKEDRGRSEEEVLAQFTNTVKPMHDAHIEPTRVHAHRIVGWTEYSDALIEELVQDIRTYAQ